MKIRQGDTNPPLQITLTADDGPVDLTDAASVRVVGVQGITQVIDESVEPSVPEEGVVARDWKPGETDTVGRIFVNVIVNWGTVTQTFPPYGSLAVDITPAEVL